jgi:acyl-CoA reductase-like NAD-dependent aldehyde dehydrogenase
VKALTFGMRLNGSSTCMAPRRLLLVGAAQQQTDQLVERLLEAFQTVTPVRLSSRTYQQLGPLLRDASLAGARVHGHLADAMTRPILVADGTPAMAITQEDIFAPVVTLIALATANDVVAAQVESPFGLSASIFGDESTCRALADQLEVGNVFINDVIVPSADPRLPFGGRRMSGFGVTQGREGLLEMTAIKTVAVRRMRSTWHFDPMTDGHGGFFAGFIRTAYADRLGERIRGVRETIRTGRHLLK